MVPKGWSFAHQGESVDLSLRGSGRMHVGKRKSQQDPIPPPQKTSIPPRDWEPRGPEPPPNLISSPHQARGPGLVRQQVPIKSLVTEPQSLEDLRVCRHVNKGEMEVQRGHWTCPRSQSKMVNDMGSYPSGPSPHYHLKEVGCHCVSPQNYWAPAQVHMDLEDSGMNNDDDRDEILIILIVIVLLLPSWAPTVLSVSHVYYPPYSQTF